MAREQRRLAAIVSADVAGYSRLMGRDESGTLAALKALRRHLVDPRIEAHGGRIVKTTGDGILLEFASVVDAVRCMVEIQTAMAENTASVPAERRITFRIGINIGDIIIDGDDIFGDGVNVAARLQELAEPGGVCVSDFVQQQVRDKLDIKLDDIGEQQVKNIARAVRAWRVAGLASPRAASASPATAMTPSMGERTARPGLAVLPFDNLGNDAEIEGFCDGLSEDLITTLSALRWVHVVSRKSSFAYKGHSPDVRKVAQELGANYVLEGSVRRAGNRVRINAQLINAVTGNHAWARRYDHDLSDPFELQDEIVRSIAGSLDYALWHGMVRGETGAGPPDPATNPLRGAAWHIMQLTEDDLRRAVVCARRAAERNPRSIAAFQYVTIGHNHALSCGWSRDPAADSAAAVEAGRQAVALNPANGLSHALYGEALAFARDRNAARASGERARALDGHSANTLAPLANMNTFAGSPGEANDFVFRVLGAAPGHYFRAVLLAHAALNCLRLGEPERGLPFAEEAAKLKPEAPYGHVARAALLGTIGRVDEAAAALTAASAARPDLDQAVIEAMMPYSDPADAARLMEALHRAGWRTRAETA